MGFWSRGAVPRVAFQWLLSQVTSLSGVLQVDFSLHSTLSQAVRILNSSCKCGLGKGCQDHVQDWGLPSFTSHSHLPWLIWSLLMVVLEEVEMVDTLTIEEVDMDTLVLEEVGMEGPFKDGTEAPPQVIQLVIEIGAGAWLSF